MKRSHSEEGKLDAWVRSTTKVEQEKDAEGSITKSRKSSVRFKAEKPAKLKNRFFPLRRFRHSFKFSSLNSPNGSRRLTFRGYFSLYRYATPCDICMMLFSSFIALMSGGCIPVMAREFGRLVNAMIMTNAFEMAEEGNVSCPGSLITSEFGIKEDQDFIYDFLLTFAPTAGAYTILNAFYFASWYISAEKQNKLWAKAYFKGLVEKDLEWFDTHGSHDYPSESIEHLSLIRQGFGVQIPFCISLVSTFICSIFCILWDGYPTVLFSLSAMAIVPIIFAAQLLISRYAAKETVAWTRAVAPIVTFAEEVIRGILAVMSYNGQRTELGRFSQEQKFLLKGFRHEALMYSVLTGMLNFVTTAYCALIFWHGLKITWDHRGCRKGEDVTDMFNTETMFTIFACLAVGMVDAWLIFPILEACRLAEESGLRVSNIIDSKSAIKSFGTEGKIPGKFEGKIEFEEVRFAFPSNKDFIILNNLSFTVEPGWKVGLVGLKGTEFSALFTLLLRHYLPDGGFIRLDNEDIRNLNRSWYVGLIGYLSNDPMLFHESIEFNIRKANPDATQAEIEQACIVAQVHDSILELPDGYDTYVGEDGRLLPPLMRLQVALARTLIQKPKILIFEEPTADLDWHCATALIEILDQASKGKTTLWIPHQLRSMTTADMIFVIEKGQIIEQGTYKELVEGNGIFSRMASKMLPVGGKGRKWEPTKPGVLHHDRSFFLPPPRFALSVYNTGLGACPDPIQVKASQAWISNKYISILAKQRYQENPPGFYQTLYETIMTEEDDDFNFIDTAEMDPDWKRCEASDDAAYEAGNYYLECEKIKDKVFFSWFSVLRQAAPSSVCICLGAFCCFVLGALTPTHGLLLGKIVEVLAEPRKTEAYQFGKELTLFMVVLAVVLGVGAFLRTLSLGIASLRSFRKVQKRLFACIIRQEKAWFDRPENSCEALTVRLSRDVGAVTYIIKYFFKTALQDGVGIVSCLLVASLADRQLFIWNLFLPPLSIFVAVMDGIVLNYWEQAAIDRMKRRVRNVALDLFNNRQTVSALHLEHYFLNRLEFVIDTYHRKLKLFPYIRGVTFALCQGGGFLLYSVYMSLVARRMKSEKVDFPTVLIIGHVFVFEMWRIGVGLSVLPNVRKAFIRVANVLKITTRTPRILLDAGFAKDFKGSVTFNGVYYWPPDYPDRQILKGATFKIDAGKTVALVGTAGSGKTICHHLIMRLLDAPQGRVEFDGTDSREINCLQLRRQVALLDQEPQLFERTVRENIAYGDNSRSVSLKEVIEAAMLANIHRFVSSLPRGYETVIGPTNTILTFSQKQRLCMARMFIKNPKILLIEEPLTALDGETERKLQNSEANLKKGRTCIIITHRIRTAETADMIIMLHNGVVQESGSHKQLMSLKNGLYKRVYKAQREEAEFFEAATISNASSVTSQNGSKLAVPQPPAEPSVEIEEVIVERDAFTYQDLADKIVEHIPRVFKI